jgi:hypothetical protein
LHRRTEHQPECVRVFVGFLFRFRFGLRVGFRFAVGVFGWWLGWESVDEPGVRVGVDEWLVVLEWGQCGG